MSDGVGQTSCLLKVKIGVQGLRFRGPVGWYVEERRLRRPLMLDVELEVAYDGSGELSGTVDLEAVVRAIKRLERKEFRLLEDLAEAAAGEALALSPRVRTVRILVHKPFPPLRACLDAEFSEVVKTRDG